MIKNILFMMFMIFIRSDQVILAPEDKSGKPIALIWIHGMQCQAEAYKKIAQQLQQVAIENGYSAWVGIPQFAFDIPEPILIDHYVQSILEDLKKQEGFQGDKYYIVAHSLGGVMAQKYVKGRSKEINGLILTSSVLLRNTRSIQNDGKTKFDFDVPTLTLNGELDGLLRVTRSAESYWHQKININEDQKQNFPLLVLEGMSHSSFMDRTMLPNFVKQNDINPEIDQTEGYKIVANSIIQFVQSIEDNKGLKQVNDSLNLYTDEFMKPFIEAMILEGSYTMKQPCYSKTLVNKKTPKCLQGASWSEYAQSVMGDDISGLDAEIKTQDNFHRVYTIIPVHLPQINNSCPTPSTGHCTLESITVTENYYTVYDIFDTGKYPIGALEMKVKLMSRQSVQSKAGNKDADFHQTDEVGFRCADINQKAIDWAMSKSNKKALERYNKFGKKLVIGDDLGPYNEGPLWIWKYLTYQDNDDKTQTLVQSPTMRTPTDYFISSAAGFHYCKLLSPFRVLEWIYHDSQLDHNSIKYSTSLNMKVNIDEIIASFD